MTPIKQTIIYNEHTIGNGDCLAACFASILDIPLWLVPPFHEMFGRPDWKSRLREWLSSVHKMEFIEVRGLNFPNDLDDEERALIAAAPEFYIATGYTVRSSYHAVVYSGDLMVHDPHSSDDGLLYVTDISYLKPIPRTERTRIGDLK